MDWAANVLALVRTGAAPELSWFDGPHRALVGAWPDQVVEGQDLQVLDRVEQAWRRDPTKLWMGWLTYELGAAPHLGRRPRDTGLPGFCLRRYPGALEFSHGRMLGHGQSDAVSRLERALLELGPETTDQGQWPLQALQAQLRPDVYRQRVRRALSFIEAGETYQVNYAQPFFAPWRQSKPANLGEVAADVYGDLRRRSPAAMGGLVAYGERFVVSNSPETLVDVRLGRTVRARSWPIKGTRPRASRADLDRAAMAQLLASTKDAAEHVMIVDLVRNDLGRLAEPGTVVADVTPQIISLPTVHHLVTEVAATLGSRWSLRSLVEALFPGGSITGAPKRRTIEIIDGLEERPRGIYCGSLIALEPGGLRLSIAIRTATLDRDGLVVHGGGGIVADSDPEDERLETLAKVRAFDP